MAIYNVNTTGSVIFPPTDITASSAVTFSIDNPSNSTSYFTLETTPNNNGFYDTLSQKSTSGSFTSNSGVTTIVSDDYHMSAVIEPGGGELYFIPENYISGSNLQFRGTGADSKIPQFFSRWKTDNTGTSNDNQITLPLVSGLPYDMTINWGDGTATVVSSSAQGNLTHTYPNSGSYTVYVTGDTFSGFRFNNGGDKLKLINISNWGRYSVNNQSAQFYGCENLDISAGDGPIIPSNFFAQSFIRRCANVAQIGTWDVSNITNFTRLLWLTYFRFDQNIGYWRTGNATNMSIMFYGSNFNNGGSDSIKNWDTSKVINLSYMFGLCPFNQPIGNWDVSKSTSFLVMFGNTTLNDITPNSIYPDSIRELSVFNQDIGNWDMSSALDLRGMFQWNKGFNNGGSDSIKNWDVSNVTQFNFCFLGSPFNQPIGNWNVSNGIDFGGMFGNRPITLTPTPRYNPVFFNQDIGSWDMSSAISISEMFSENPYFNNGGSDSIRNWNVSSVVTASLLFQSASSFNQPLDGWNTSNIVNFSASFKGATSFDQDLSSWNVESAQNMAQMFEGVTLSTSNYDALLVSWASQSLQSGVVFDGGNSKYTGTFGSEPSASRAKMIDTYSWTITDGGPV